MIHAALLAAGFLAWAFSTLSGGGGALILVPVVGFLAGVQAVAPTVTLAALIGGGGRLFVFRKEIDWRIVRWSMPGAVLGGVAGAALFASAPAQWLQIVIGVFLLSAPLQYALGKRERTFPVRDWYFLPAQALVGLISGLVGAVGPVMNVLYLNAGIDRAALSATKTMASTPMQLAKLAAYLAFGALSGQIWLFGLAAGLGAFVSNWAVKPVLQRMSAPQFRLIATAVMAFSGALMIWGQRAVLSP